jgi:hypothetical protein
MLDAEPEGSRGKKAARVEYFVHGELPHPVDQRGAATLLALAALHGDLLRLLGQVQRGDGVLAHRLLILLVQLGVLVADDLAEPNLRQLLGHQLLVEQARGDQRHVPEGRVVEAKWAVAIAKRTGPSKARVALARKLAVILHAMWRSGTPYQERAAA